MYKMDIILWINSVRHWQFLSHGVVLSTQAQFELTFLSDESHWMHGRCKSVYHAIATTEACHNHLDWYSSCLFKIACCLFIFQQRWVAILSPEYPTMAFHASITNPFGKGAMINLLRQFAKVNIQYQMLFLHYNLLQYTDFCLCFMHNPVFWCLYLWEQVKKKIIIKTLISSRSWIFW